MKRGIIIALLGIIIFSPLLAFEIIHTEKMTDHIESGRANYTISVKPVAVESGEPVNLTIKTKNKGSERLNITLSTRPGLERASVSVPPDSSNITSFTIIIEVEKATEHPISVIVSEDTREPFRKEFFIQVQPAIPPRTPAYVAIGIMSIFILYSSLIIIIDLLGETIWIHNEPLKYLVGMVIGSFSLLISNDWVWDLFGFINDGITIPIFIIVLTLVLLVYYIGEFSDIMNTRDIEAPE